MSELPLIVGAGPVGLAAAVFFTQKNTPVRIIDKNASRTHNSKALAVNPRTLELLDPTGVTRQMLAVGKKICGGIFWGSPHGDTASPIADVSFSDLPHKYPFMLALAQATSERLLEEALVAAGGRVERGTELITCRTLIGKAEATLSIGDGSANEVVQVPWLFAADGARSTVRHILNIDFKGESESEAWHLVDVPMDIDLADDRAHILFVPRGGFMFVMRVVGDEAGRLPLWRVMGDMPNPLDQLRRMRSLSADPPVWTSSFHVSHRLATKLQVDKICLGGDAAHIHSPAGARGMNLGIEDAWEFSARVMRGMLAGYGASRIPIDRAVVRRIGKITRTAQGRSIIARAQRSVMLPLGSDIGFLRRRALQTLAGIDHPIERNGMALNGEANSPSSRLPLF